MSELEPTFDPVVLEFEEAAVGPERVIASASFTVRDQVQIRSASFDSETPVASILIWANTCQSAEAGMFDKPFLVTLVPDEGPA